MTAARLRLQDDYRAETDRALERLRQGGFGHCEVGLVLGSGLGNVVDGMEVSASMPFGEVPGLPSTTVQAHSGRILQARGAGGVAVAVFQGRLHAYEGLPMEQIVRPVAILAALGCHTVLLTNAAGGLDADMCAGDVMVISDLVDLHWVDAGRGLLQPDGDVPVELALRAARAGRVFDPVLVQRLLQTGARHGVPIRSGTYASLWGPNYETAAEIGMLRRIHANAVGMSTGPEAVFARALGLRVAGLSCITNVAVEFGGGEVTHEEVIEVGAARRGAIAEVVLASLPHLAAPEGGERG